MPQKQIIHEREAKAERLEVRLTSATKSLLSQAARQRHTTLTEFLISSAVEVAHDTLISPKIFEIHSDAGWDALMRSIDGSDTSLNDSKIKELYKNMSQKSISGGQSGKSDSMAHRKPKP